MLQQFLRVCSILLAILHLPCLLRAFNPLPLTPPVLRAASADGRTVALCAKKKVKSRDLSTSSKGFGASGSSVAISSKKKPRKKMTTYHLDPAASIADVLDPRILEPNTISDIQQRLRSGNVVVLRNAFREDLAEAMHEQLDYLTDAQWIHHEDYFPDGYHYRHSNIYQTEDFPPLLRQVNAMLESTDTKGFVTKLSGRDCNGSISGAPSYYRPGDHSLPHTDHVGQRTVAYIWHLSKEWKPEWGGALYWAPEPLANAYHHASFNTLVLFSVTPHSVCIPCFIGCHRCTADNCVLSSHILLRRSRSKRKKSVWPTMVGGMLLGSRRLPMELSWWETWPLPRNAWPSHTHKSLP